MMEISQDIVSCYSVNSYVSGFHVMKEFTFSGMKVRSWRSSILRSSQRIQNFIDWYHLQSHIKAMKKKEFIPLLCLPTFLHMMMRLKVHCFYLQLEEESDFLHAVAIQAGQNFNQTFEENGSLLSSITAKICFKILMKSLVDHFLSIEFSIRDWQKLKLVLFTTIFYE